MTNRNDKGGELLGQERRRCWSPEQKLAMVRESLQPGQSVSVVARQNGVNANQLFQWRKLYQNGSLSAVSAGQSVVPASELADALKQIRELQRMLGEKTMQVVLSVDKMESLKIVALYPTVLAVPALDTLYRRADLQRFRPIKSVFRNVFVSNCWQLSNVALDW